MTRAPRIAGALVLCLALGAAAADVDQPGGASPVPQAAVSAKAAPLPEATAAFRDALNVLHQERQTFVESFDWTPSGDRVALKRSYGERMKAFDRRELELKRDWYQASGQTELLARTEAALVRHTQPRQALPDLDPTHSAGAPTQTPELTR